MLDVLHQIESQLPGILEDVGSWSSLFVDYHPPVVERLWREWSGFRVYLHRIHPCKPGEALFHPHPWPSAMRILDGNYEMALGYGVGEQEPPVAARLIMGAGSEYEMTNPDGWHYVRPILRPTMSLMITGKPWSRPSPRSEKPLSQLSREKMEEILGFFRKYYNRK